jgi:hypothetical protein
MVQSSLMVLAVVAVTGAQSTEPPISDTRLTVHTLVREDIFAGFLDNNMDRFARGERNIELLLKERPTEKANLVAWRGGADLYRAVVAHESGKREEFTRQLQQARDDFAEAAKLATGNDGVSRTGCPRNTARRPGRRPMMPIQSCGKRREPR